MSFSRGIVPFSVVAFLAVGLGACAPEPEIAADLVLRGGKVVTVDENIPDGEAIAVKGDTILAVGTDDEISVFIGRRTEVIDLDGQLAIPGFVESHAHFLGVGDSKMQLNLMDVESWDEIISMVEAVVGDAASGELIRGRGWHQEKWNAAP
ncbi:MAG: amidohydrolase family protein, partial [Gemmatimonadota bacterium]|nr:amidohydrolase family protein [Gemmatimonadota bacterium]